MYIIIISPQDGYLELIFSMKVPLQVVKETNAVLRKYKYHVESPLTQKGSISSLEFIAGIKTGRGEVIDRSLRLHVLDPIQNGCKCGTISH